MGRRRTVTKAAFALAFVAAAVLSLAVPSTRLVQAAETPALTVAKTTNAPKALYNPPTGPNVIVSTADEGDTITYKLTYTVHGVLSYPIIEDVIPAGLTYVDNSATHSDDLYPTDGYDPTTRTLTWIAPPHLNVGSVSTSGSVTYKVKVDAGAAGLPQPLTNTATVHSDFTGPETATHLLFVGALPDSVTALPTGPLPTAPGTDIVASGPAAPFAPSAGGWLVVVGLMAVAISMALVHRSRRERHR